MGLEPRPFSLQTGVCVQLTPAAGLLAGHGARCQGKGVPSLEYSLRMAGDSWACPGGRGGADGEPRESAEVVVSLSGAVAGVGVALTKQQQHTAAGPAHGQSQPCRGRRGNQGFWVLPWSPKKSLRAWMVPCHSSSRRQKGSRDPETSPDPRRRERVLMPTQSRGVRVSARQPRELFSP